MKRSYPDWLPLMAAALLAGILMFASYRHAMAQGIWVGECTAAKPCHVIADPPAEATECVLIGASANVAPTKPVIDKAQITPVPTSGLAEIKPRTCWWYPVVLAPGSYTLTAIVRDGQGRTSDPSNPIAVTVLTPVAAPQNLRLVQ